MHCCIIYLGSRLHTYTVFLFSCVPEDECGRVNNKLTIRNSDLLLTKEALAENSNCDGPNDVCCHEDDTYFYPEDKMCSAIDGYSCASPINCKVTEINENNLAGCSDVDTRIWSGSTGMICCAKKDIKISPKSCSSFEGRR